MVSKPVITILSNVAPVICSNAFVEFCAAEHRGQPKLKIPPASASSSWGPLCDAGRRRGPRILLPPNRLWWWSQALANGLDSGRKSYRLKIVVKLIGESDRRDQRRSNWLGHPGPGPQRPADRSGESVSVRPRVGLAVSCSGIRRITSIHSDPTRQARTESTSLCRGIRPSMLYIA